MIKQQLTINNIVYLLPCIALCFFFKDSYGQRTQKQLHDFSTISFQHLTTANGLSYGSVNDLCSDKTGNVWLATPNGLNMFNGKTVTKYYVTDYPLLGSDNILQVICDDNNRIWMLTDKRTVTMIDEQRHLHKIGLYADKALIKTRNIIFSKTKFKFRSAILQ